MYALGLLGDTLYMIGGQMKVRHHYIITDSVERWSLKRGGSWISFAPLPLPLACPCAVSLKEHLYVLAGWTPQVPVKKHFQYSVGECTDMSLSKKTLVIYQVQPPHILYISCFVPISSPDMF